jgi:hypothetical protein
MENERYISGIKSNLIIRDEFSNPGYIVYVTNRRIFGIKNVSITTHLISPHVYNPQQEGEIIKTPPNISELEINNDFSINKEDIRKIEIIRPESGGMLRKWTIVGTFSGLGSIKFIRQNDAYERLLLYEKGYPAIKEFFEKYLSRYLEIKE